MDLKEAQKNTGVELEEGACCLEKKVVCANQLNRPEVHFPVEGAGDCTRCKYDPVNNPSCAKYIPVSLYELDVTDEGD